MFKKLFTGLKNLYFVIFPPVLIDVYRKMGVQIGKDCKFQFGVIIDYSHYWLIKIGNNVTLAPNVHILSHDASTKNDLNFTKIGLVEIKNNVFVGAGSIILPGVIIGENTIIGAGSVVSKEIPANSVAAGNPCRVICKYDDYILKQSTLMNSENCFNESYTLRGNVTEAKMKEMVKVLEKHKIGFVI